ncbi:tetratricopeptide repeat protein [Consotaella aegiceratis]|uniref:tetratricopeptide repeat protein n=1 Tax=Consotaella aegiceratis TaxID=3097961 RepID=UPI002F4087FB
MRAFIIGSAILLALSTAPASAQDMPAAGLDETLGLAPPSQDKSDDEGVALGQPTETRQQKLDALFAELKREPAAPKAARIASRIQSLWNTSGSATIDLLMQWSAEAMAQDESAAALDLLDQAVALQPDYAEAWNRRATLHYTLENLGKSLDDIRQTLSREPRHFGALMGLAAILEQLGKDQQALDVYMRVLEVYPANKGAQEAVGRLSEDMAGQAT